jgi:asparagine synthase (glutamine-hydrolysing)
LADSSNVPTYLIAKLAREHVKVVLTGDGGDELLAGYSYWYQPLLSMQENRDHRDAWKYILIPALAFSRLVGMNLRPSSRFRALGAFYALRGGCIADAHDRQQQYFTDRELTRFGLDPPERYDGFGPDPTSDTVDDAFRLDIERYMPGDILVKIDRASMANGLELRAPFLDVDFASFCISLPYRLKIDKEQDKRILRQAYSESWPPSVRKRGKQGFGAPVGRWLQLPRVRALKGEYLDNPRGKLFSILPFDRTRRAARENDYHTWILLVLALWAERHDWNLA